MKKSGSLLLLCILAKGLLAQDIHVSQFYETPLLRNPALAGLFTGDIRVQSVYRTQWQSVSYPYTTKTVSAEYKFAVGSMYDFMTLGLQAFQDIAGVTRLRTLEIMPALNFHKSLSNEKNMYLSAGFMGGLVQRNFDDKSLTFDNQYTGGRFNPTAPSGENFSYFKRAFIDYAAGLSFNSSLPNEGNYYAGLALFHFTKPSETYMQQQFFLHPKVQANVGIHTPLNEVWELQGEANYLQQGSFSELLAGGIATIRLTESNAQDPDLKTVSLGGGLFIRVNDAIVPVLKLNYNNIDIGISYDVNTSKLSPASKSKGGYELSLSYRGFTSSQNSSLNMVRCPQF